MQDYNFFAPFLRGRKKPENKTISWGVIGILVLVGAIAWPAYNFVQLRILDSRIEGMQQDLISSPDYPKMEQVDALLSRLQEQRVLLSSLDQTAEQIEQIQGVDEQLLFSISVATPMDITLQSLDVNQGVISIQGTAASKPAVAEYEYNLRELGLFERIFVPVISDQTTEGEEQDQEQPGAWQFNMDLQLEGGPANEIN